MIPYIGEIRWFPFDYEVQGWAICDGRMLIINTDTQDLFVMIRNYFGGDGMRTFALPDLRGRAIVGASRNPYQGIGAQYGLETVALTAPQMPAHGHAATAVSAAGDRFTATGARPAGTAFNLYGGGGTVPLSAETVGFAGYGQAHDNMQPFVVLNACICYQGAWPQQQGERETPEAEGGAR